MLLRPAMKFLMDTNILIPAEPTTPDEIDRGHPLTIELLRTLAEGHHQIYIHPASIEDLSHDLNPIRQQTRHRLLRKYLPLLSPPDHTASLNAQLGVPRPGSNDEIDRRLLSAVVGDAVDYLVTEDRDLARDARSIALNARVVGVAEALSIVRALFPVAPLSPPAVRRTLAHDLPVNHPIFDSFLADYPAFEAWLQKAKREHRLTWIVEVPHHPLAGFCIVKAEPDGEHGIAGPALKLCSFKISDQTRGYRFGELLIKTVLDYAFANRYRSAYVTVFSRHSDLVRLFEDFGFTALDALSASGELILWKPLVFDETAYEGSSPLEFHVRFGPRHFKFHDVSFFLVPIQPSYHRLLFPETDPQMSLLPGLHAFGNSIRKAYLSNSITRQLAPGDVVLFYRSEDEQSVRCIGVVEETLVSERPDEIARFVGQRTVYPYDQIAAMCERPVLAILFRHARSLDHQLTLLELIRHGVVQAAPQSITRAREEGTAWIREQLGR